RRGDGDRTRALRCLRHGRRLRLHHGPQGEAAHHEAARGAGASPGVGGSAMRTYLLSLGAGLLVGVIYSLLNVRSPAPPDGALLRLLGMLLGEQVIPVSRQLLAGTALQLAWRLAQCT